MYDAGSDVLGVLMARAAGRPLEELPAVPGRFGWDGGTGTSVCTDPSEGSSASR